MATLLQGNQELLVVRDKVGRPPGELGVSKSLEYDIFPIVLVMVSWLCVERSGVEWSGVEWNVLSQTVVDLLL